MKTKTHYLFIALLICTTIIVGCKDDEEDPPIVDTSAEDYAKADGSIGGIMYDKFWSTESGFDQNSSNLATLKAAGDFFRCKQCHGWDGLGTKGAYINRGAKTTRPHVSPLGLYEIAQTKTSKELFDAMKATEHRRNISTDLSTYDPVSNATEGDKMPNYNELLTDAQIWGLVKFMKEGMFDVSKIYDATYTGTYPTGSFEFSNWGKDGNGATGNTLVTGKCAACHGLDGKKIDLGGKTLGKFVRAKSYEVQHKVMYGQLGSVMTGEFDLTLTDMKNMYKAFSDTTDFPD
jgi:mono/diheme cytochrome c family protein